MSGGIRSRRIELRRRCRFPGSRRCNCGLTNRFSIVYESISLGHLRNELYKIDTRVLGRASRRWRGPKDQQRKSRSACTNADSPKGSDRSSRSGYSRFQHVHSLRRDAKPRRQDFARIDRGCSWLVFVRQRLLSLNFTMRAGTKGFAAAWILRSSLMQGMRWPGIRPQPNMQKGGTMNRLDLPKHIVEKVERRWAQKLQEQAAARKSSRSEAHGATTTGVPVIGRGKSSRRSRRHGKAV